MSDTSPRIERGAALLDLSAPGWDKKIDLNILDLSHIRYCIIGQVYGDYYNGLATLDQGAETAPAWHGFTVWGQEMYVTLTDKWREFILARRERKAAA